MQTIPPEIQALIIAGRLARTARELAEQQAAADQRAKVTAAWDALEARLLTALPEALRPWARVERSADARTLNHKALVILVPGLAEIDVLVDAADTRVVPWRTGALGPWRVAVPDDWFEYFDSVSEALARAADAEAQRQEDADALAAAATMHTLQDAGPLVFAVAPDCSAPPVAAEPTTDELLARLREITRETGGWCGIGLRSHDPRSAGVSCMLNSFEDGIPLYTSTCAFGEDPRVVMAETIRKYRAAGGIAGLRESGGEE